MKIFIAAGHGGSDPGSGENGAIERDEAIKVVEGAIKLLRPAIKAGDELIQVPNELALTDTVRWINQRTTNPGRDICLELHFNNNVGNPGTGTETYFGARKMADVVHKHLVTALALHDRGLKDGMHLMFNRSTKPLSALVEIGFLNNPGDLARVRAVGALAFAMGIAAYLGVNLPTTSEPTQPGNGWKEKYLATKNQLEFVKEEISKILVQVQ